MAKKKLNSLDRFRKRSPKLVLEEHETPIGCGGVVLRWRDPSAAQPVHLYLYTPVESKLFLDGRLIEAEALDISPGPHVVGVEIDDTRLDAGLLMFVASHETGRPNTVRPPGVEEKAWRVVSDVAGGWRAVTERPDASWTGEDFDDAGWAALDRADGPPPINWGHPRGYRAHQCVTHGAAFLMLAGRKGTNRVWVRGRLVVPGPQIS